MKNGKGETMQILDALWFTQMGNPHQTGIVIGKDKVDGKIKCYIGYAKSDITEDILAETDEQNDREYIAKTGAKFPLEAARLLFPYLFEETPEEVETAIEALWNKKSPERLEPDQKWIWLHGCRIGYKATHELKNSQQ